MTPDDSIGVLARITAIFEAVGDDDLGIGVSELAARVGLPKSTVSRLVGGLVRAHYLERDGTRIRLGLRLFELGQLAETPRLLRRAALPVMSALCGETGADIELSIRDGADLVRIAVVRGRSPGAAGAESREPGTAEPTAPVGERTPVRSTVQGRAVLARSPHAELLPGADPGAGIAVAVSPVTAMPSGIEAALSATLVTHDGRGLSRLASAVDAAAAEIARRL